MQNEQDIGQDHGLDLRKNLSNDSIDEKEDNCPEIE